jgi:protein-disulfide isomerase
MGSGNAPLGMVIFSDFECPYCRQFATTVLPQLEAKYVTTGLLTIAFRHLPLAVHPHAKQAAEFGVCALQQGTFWPFHNAVFSETSLSESALRAVATRIGLDDARLQTCLANAAPQVDTDTAAAMSLHISGTPSILIGLHERDGRIRVTQIVRGAQPLNVFTDAVERLQHQS